MPTCLGWDHGYVLEHNGLHYNLDGKRISVSADYHRINRLSNLPISLAYALELANWDVSQD